MEYIDSIEVQVSTGEMDDYPLPTCAVCGQPTIQPEMHCDPGDYDEY